MPWRLCSVRTEQEQLPPVGLRNMNIYETIRRFSYFLSHHPVCKCLKELKR